MFEKMIEQLLYIMIYILMNLKFKYHKKSKNFK